MKRLICVLYAFILVIIGYLIINTLRMSAYKFEGYIGSVASVENEDVLITKDYNYDYDYVYLGKIKSEETIESQVKLSEYSITANNENLFHVNAIYKKGDSIDGTVIEYDSRVVKINGKTIYLENLEKAFVSFYMRSLEKVSSDINFDFDVRVFGEIVEVQEYDISYDQAKNRFLATLSIDNSYYMTSGFPVKVKYHKYVSLEPEKKYVLKDYVVRDGDEYYLLKLIRFNQFSYYRRIPISVLEEQDHYYMIEGELNDGNVIVKQR